MLLLVGEFLLLNMFQRPLLFGPFPSKRLELIFMIKAKRSYLFFANANAGIVNILCSCPQLRLYRLMDYCVHVYLLDVH